MIPLPSLTDKRSALAAGFDAATPDERVNFIRGLGMGQLKATWALCEADPVPLPLDALVGAEGEVVVHEGQNSLPAFTRFQKRIVRRDGVVQGYNHNPALVAWFGGPGHFTVHAHRPDVLRFDYTHLAADVPEGFPALTDNGTGRRKLVYGGLEDHVRRVSRHVSIGRLSRGGKEQPMWFLLCRVGDPGEHDASGG
jgi:hypothetical protein